MSPARLLLLAVILLQPLLWLWPLPVALPGSVVGAGSSEVGAHLWGYWLMGHEGVLYGVDSTMVAWPQGVRVEIIDPLHRLPFILGNALGGPALGYSFVLVFGVQVAGLAGALLAREADADPWGQVLAAVAAGSGATLIGAAGDGITEGLGVGWVGLQLALLLRLGRLASGVQRPPAVPFLERPLVVTALLALSIAAAAHAGPYNAVWVALIDVPVGLYLLRRSRLHLVGGALGAALSMPFLLQVSSQEAGSPGSRVGLELPNLGVAWRGAFREGVDVLDLFLPDALTGVPALAPTTAYLGLVLVVLAGLGLRRTGRSGLPWLLGAAAFAVLALGPWLMVGGAVVEASGRPLLAPVGLLEDLPVFGRMTRWYRAGAVAVLLLAPLAARALPGRLALLGALLVGLDARVGSPVPWPLPTVELPRSEVLAGLDGPIAGLPAEHPIGVVGTVAHLGLLHQLNHGQPLNSPWENLAVRPPGDEGINILSRVCLGLMPVRENAVAKARVAGTMLHREGFRYLVIYLDVQGITDPTVLDEAFGPPLGEDRWVRVYRLPDR